MSARSADCRPRRRIASAIPGDWATYRRLLSYLKGDSRTVWLVFACILLESLFTVLTISAVKPVLDVLGDEPLLGSLHTGKGTASFDLSGVHRRADGTRVIVGAGEIATRKDAGKLHERFANRLDGNDRTPLIADLTNVQRLDVEGWNAIVYGVQQAGETSTPLLVILRSEVQPPVILASVVGTDVENVTSATATVGPRPRILHIAAGAPAPPSDPVAPLRFFERPKKAVIEWAAPRTLAVQQYAEESRANKFRVLGMLVGAMLFSATLMVAAGFGVGYLSSYLAGKVVQRLRDHTFRHMLGLDLSHFSSHSTGSQMSIILQDVQAVSGAVDILFGSVFKTPVTVAMLILAMFAVSPSLTLFTFVVLPLLGTLIYILGRRVRRVSGRVQKARGALSVVLEEAFSGMRVVKAYNMEDREAERFEDENRRILRLGMRTTAAEEVGTGATQLIGVATVGLMLLAGGYMVVVTGELRYSSFFLFVGFLTQVFRPLKGISKTNSKLQRGLAGCDRVFKILDKQPLIVDKPGAVAAGPLRDGIRLDGIRFRYTEDRPWALDDVSLRLAAGQSIALVGQAGCGKSTLANLIPRFYDPTTGTVIWDGTDLRDLSVASLRDQIALITQEVILFDDTVAANIAYGAGAEVTRNDVERSAIAARAHDFIMRMPQGYDTPIGNRGLQLSGGQRQCLAFARAILKDAPVLILDEATSALDSETESLVQAALADLMKNRTVLVIAHRLSTIQHCDEICVMDAGKIVERGTHDELLAKNGRYARFHRIQYGLAAAAAE